MSRMPPASDLVLWSEGGPGHSLSSSRSGPRKAKPAHWAESSNPDRRTQDSDVRDRWKPTPLRAGGAGMEEGPPHSKLGIPALPWASASFSIKQRSLLGRVYTC